MQETIIALLITQMILIVFIFQRLRVIEVTKEIQIVSKPKKDIPFTPIVIKAKTGLGNHIINDLKHGSESGTEG